MIFLHLFTLRKAPLKGAFRPPFRRISAEQQSNSSAHLSKQKRSWASVCSCIFPIPCDGSATCKHVSCKPIKCETKTCWWCHGSSQIAARPSGSPGLHISVFIAGEKSKQLLRKLLAFSILGKSHWMHCDFLVSESGRKSPWDYTVAIPKQFVLQAN